MSYTGELVGHQQGGRWQAISGAVRHCRLVCAVTSCGVLTPREQPQLRGCRAAAVTPQRLLLLLRRRSLPAAHKQRNKSLKTRREMRHIEEGNDPYTHIILSCRTTDCRALLGSRAVQQQQQPAPQHACACAHPGVGRGPKPGRLGGSRLRRSLTERTRTILEWMAADTQ